MSSPRYDSTNRSVNLPALLSLLTGAGLLFSTWKFDFLFEELDGTLLATIKIGMIVLIIWGAVGFFVNPMRDRKSRAGLIRHRVYLPRPGQFYLLIMIVVFSGALLGRSNMLMLVFAMLAGPFVINGWITYTMLKRTAVERKAPRRVMAGEPTAIDLSLINRKRVMTCWLMSVSDRIRNADERLQAGVLFNRVPANSRSNAPYQVRLMRRGRYELGPVQLTARFPLGIVERGRDYDLPGEILVYPRLGRLSARWMRDHFLASDLVERRELRQGAFDDEFHRIREFRWGDNPRAIHWRSSARNNSLMLREYHQSRDLSLQVLVDLWLPGKGGQQARERLELAISVAASISIAHMRQSRDSSLHVYLAGRKLDQWEGESRIANADPLMDRFALAEGTDKPAILQMLETAARERVVGVRTVLVTPRAGGSNERIELDRQIAAAGTKEAVGKIAVLESDPVALASMFEFV